ncbi:unnamed protein product [Scytosiphon promiscuus]
MRRTPLTPSSSSRTCVEIDSKLDPQYNTTFNAGKQLLTIAATFSSRSLSATRREDGCSLAMFPTGISVLAGLIGLACTRAEILAVDQPLPGRQQPADEFSAARERIGALLAYGEPGICHLKSPMYHWRNVGFGSNLNQLLKRWVGSIRSGYQDCGMDVTQDCLQQVRCSSGEAGMAQEIVGWRCMFKPMPRLCTLETGSELEDQRIARLNYASDITGKHPLQEPPDKATVASAIVDFIYSHMQPWFEEDINAILRERTIATLREENFVAIHVRRGDKLRKEASRVEVSVYLQAAALHLWESSGDRSGVASISGIWVSSDDSTVFPEVQALASRYFPNVQADKIITISFRDDGPDHPTERRDELSTKSYEMTYELYVGLNAELKMMSEADVFIGTFSSNIARFVYLMRDSNGLSRNSTVSVDEPVWSLK